LSATDLHGNITYANNVFLKIADYTEEEILGKPHSIVRHPAMPRAVFKLLWDTLRSGKEIFALVQNRAKNEVHYWVMAHATPSFDANGRIAAYHSTRRAPDRSAIDAITPVYTAMLQAEQQVSPSEAVSAGVQVLNSALAQAHQSYDAFLFSLV